MADPISIYDVVDDVQEKLGTPKGGAPIATVARAIISSADDGEAYDQPHSFQPVGPDLNLAAGAGSTAANPKFLAAVMGNVLGDLLTKAGAYIAGVIGAFSITGSKSTVWPTGAVLGVIMDGVTAVDGAVTAHIDGGDPSSVTTANAAFKAMQRNTNASSGYNYGLDLHDPDVVISGDTFHGTKILKATLRSAKEVCWLEKAGVPTDGTDGATFAEKGSLCTDLTNGNLYINGGTKASPTWKLVTRAA